MKRTKRLIATALALALTLSVAVTAASAYSSDVYSAYAPDDIMTVDKGVLSGSTAAANTTAMSILGINVTSTDDAGALNSAHDPEMPINLLIFGSEANENPDPYLWNFYYNLDKNGYPIDPDWDASERIYSDELFGVNGANWTGDYTLLNDAKSGPTGGASTDKSQPIYVNGVNKNCDPLFFYEPGVLMGSSTTSYDYGLSLYTYNPFYNPLQVGGWNTNAYCLNDGTVNSTFAMANGVYTMAKEIQAYADVNGLVGRYNNGSVLQCGIDYSNFALGIYYFVQGRLNPASSLIGKIDKATYCTGISISEYGEITVTNANDSKMQKRYLQYMDGIADEAEADKTYSSYGDLKKDVDLVIMDTSELTERQMWFLDYVHVKVVDINSIMPQTAYGTTMQSADNILGVPYFVGLLYEGNLSNNKESLSEYDYTAYFIKNIYHVKDEDVEEVLKEMIGDGCGDAYNGYTGLTSGYEGYINQMIQIGAAYYKETIAQNGGTWLAVDEGLS